jgi:hypothetical protein
MIVIGLKQLPAAEAERHFAAVFTHFLRELRRGQWSNWSDFARFYPKASCIDDGTVHIPLTQDGSGIVSAVSFNPGIVRLLRIALSSQAARHATLSHPKHQPQPHATIP